MKRFFNENTAAACSGFAANCSSPINDKINFMNFNAEDPFESLLNKIKSRKILNKLKQNKEKRAQDESMV